MKFLCLLILVLVCFGRSRASNGFLDSMRSWLNLDHLMGWNVDRKDYGDNVKDALDMLDKEKIRFMLRGIQLEKTAIAPLLDETPEENILSNILEDFSLPNLAEIIKKDSSVAREIIERVIIRDRMEQEIYEGDDLDGGPEQYEEQTGGYEGCRRDYNALAQPATNFILDTITNGSIPTFERNATRWGRKMVDSMGKMPPGLTTGALYWVGAFEKCEEISEVYNYTERQALPPFILQETREIQGHYCRLELRPKGDDGEGGRFMIRIGLCVPDSCKSENISYYIQEENIVLSVLVDRVLNMNVETVLCDKEMDPSTDSFLLGCVYFMVTIVIIGILASLYEGLFRKEIMKKKMIALLRETKPCFEVPPAQLSKPALLRQLSTSSQAELITDEAEPQDVKPNDHLKPSFMERLEVLFIGFSFYNNTRRIFKMEAKDGHFPVIDGLRFLSFGYAIYGHTWLFGPVYNESWLTTNIVPALLEYPNRLSFQPVINFHFSSDTFFVISGFLVAYWWLKNFEVEKRISFGLMVRYYLHRYWRIMPAFMIVLMLFTATAVYGWGPMSPSGIADRENCESSWWVNMLLLHNIVNTDKQCLAPQWYLSCFWQLYVITPVVLVPLVLKPLFGYIALAALFVIQIGAAAGVSANLFDDPSLTFWDWYLQYFMTPWCRAGPYLVGIATGILMYKKERKISMHWLVIICGWAVCAVCILAPAYSTYGVLKEGGENWSKEDWVFFDTFSRTAWGLGIAWIIVACQSGYGGVINNILTWGPFLPLSRLVFCSFLMHVMMIFLILYGMKDLIYVNGFNILYMALSNTWVIFLIGFFLVALCIHYPISLGIERAIVVKTKWQCIFAGVHPSIEEVTEGMDLKLGLDIIGTDPVPSTSAEANRL